jgi:hypothetical protein
MKKEREVSGAHVGRGAWGERPIRLPPRRTTEGKCFRIHMAIHVALVHHAS